MSFNTNNSISNNTIPKTDKHESQFGLALGGHKSPLKSISVQDSIKTTIKEDDSEMSRDTWDNPIEFLLSCISMSVGLGNIWLFPTTAARNGGGAFLIPYLTVLLVIGRPLYYLDMCLGQFSKSGQVRVWNMIPGLKGIGYGTMMGTISVCSFYCAVMGITVYYFCSSFASTLPWAECSEDRIPPGFPNCSDPLSDGNEPLMFFLHVFPQLENLDSGLGKLHWKIALCLIFSWMVIYLSLIRAVKSSGKVAYFTTIFPYVVLFILLIRGVTLEGAWTGIKIFIEPDWSRLGEAKVWYYAVQQCFFSLAAGFGPVIMLSSHNKFRQNIYRDAMIVSLLDTATSILAGCTIFSVMGNLIVTKGLKFDEIGAGPALIFVTYPKAISQFRWAPQFFSVLFFLMFFTLGIGSATNTTAGIITVICDEFTTFKRWIVTAVVCGMGAAIGLMYCTEGGLLLIDVVSNYGATFVIYIFVIVETIGICYVYGLENLCNDIEFMLGRKTGIYWRLCWALVIPVGLTVIFLYNLIADGNFKCGAVECPESATIAGWLYVAFIVSLIPGFAIYAVGTEKGSTFKEKFFNAFQATSEWGPQQTKVREEWLAFKLEKEKTGKKFKFGIF